MTSFLPSSAANWTVAARRHGHDGVSVVRGEVVVVARLRVDGDAVLTEVAERLFAAAGLPRGAERAHVLGVDVVLEDRGLLDQADEVGVVAVADELQADAAGGEQAGFQIAGGGLFGRAAGVGVFCHVWLLYTLVDVAVTVSRTVLYAVSQPSRSSYVRSGPDWTSAAHNG